MKIALLGANGRTGREVLAGALSAGHTVTALVRGEEKLADVSHAQLKVCVASPCEPAVLEPLLPGHDVVISTLGPRRPTKAATAIYSESAAAIVEAMQRSGVNRLLVTSSALLFPAHSLFERTLKRLVPSIVREAGRMETQIRASNLDWTIARMGFLTNDAATSYRLAEDALPEGGGSISRAAVAHFLLTEAEHPSHVRQVVGLLAGPRQRFLTRNVAGARPPRQEPESFESEPARHSSLPRTLFTGCRSSEMGAATGERSAVPKQHCLPGSGAR